MPGFGLRFLLFISLLLGSGAAFAACVPEDYAYEVELAGLGVVYTGDFRYNSARDEAELLNGVCFVSSEERNLTLTAPTMRVERVQTAPTFLAEGATLTLESFTLFAERLSGDAAGLGLQNLSVMSPQFSGSAVRARYTLKNGRTILTGVRVRLGDFRLESRAAGLTESTLVLQDARASTCACEGGGLYTLRSPQVAVNLLAGTVRVEDGTLHTLGLSFALEPNLRLRLDGTPGAGRRVIGGTTLLPTPAAPEPVGAVIDEGTKVALPLRLLPWASLEVGAAGFDDEHPTGLVALLNLSVGRLRAALGRVGPGVRADALLRTPLSPGVGVDLSTTNRDWEDAGFLHEAALSVYANRRLTQVAGAVSDALLLSGQVFSALSRQTLAGVGVASPRLGLRGGAVYSSSPTPLGAFAVRTEVGAIYYPLGGGDAAQLGVRVLPSWRGQFGAFRTGFSFDHQAVFGLSPFSVALDRLEPRSVVDASVAWAGVGSSLTLQGRYAFRLADATNPVRMVRLDASRTLPFGSFSTVNRFTAEVAGLLGPPDEDVEAFVGAETGFVLPSALELGVKARYDLLPRAAGLKLLEVYASYPLTFPGVTLRPFLGLNAAPLLTGEPLPTVTGYGLAVAFKSCCGTLVASYRFHDETVRTAFDVRLAPEPAATYE